MSIKKTAALTLALALLLTACPEQEENHQERDEDTQDQVQTKLQEKIPAPNIDGAAARSAIRDHLLRWQNEDVVSYVNLFAENGRPIGFYTAQGKVASTCQMLTSPDRRHDEHDGDLIRAAPALDGTYYGDNVQCGHFFFTADSDAYVEVHGGIMLITDQPLEDDLQPLDVNIQGAE